MNYEILYYLRFKGISTVAIGSRESLLSLGLFVHLGINLGTH